MPPQASSSLPPPSAKLSLQEWLKVLSSRGVDMRVAMGLAAKIYKTHNTIELLSKMTPAKVAGLTDDKETRKVINNMVKGLVSGEPVSKKRGRDSDLLQPLKKDEEEEDTPIDMSFQFVTEREQLQGIRVITNRAPVKTAWAYVICMRLGFNHLESLSFAQAYVHINSLKHALMLGNILGEEETRDAQMELEDLPDGGQGNWSKKKSTRPGRDQITPTAAMGSSQPWVGILGSKIPIIERSDGTCRAIQKGVSVRPSQAYMYIRKNFKDHTPHVLGALKLIADSYESEELNRVGLHMYNEFKPDVVEWGQRGELELDKVLEFIKGENSVKEGDNQGHSVMKPAASFSAPTLSPIGTTQPLPPEAPDDERANKKPKPDMTVEEYEAMLDAEYLQGDLPEF
ncbi:hypothetical protein CNBG_4140 [Cryptococcus deuterogattii R265]|uniref:uncharacterized protein n=1 Tax=Cryptococcus deuterogattii (strain R265) TaxID=294750 RepID=UPI001936D25B|nr:hypothetical protein CNBG_4140 [Cryptococcus deuterogattii R265]